MSDEYTKWLVVRLNNNRYEYPEYKALTIERAYSLTCFTSFIPSQ